MWEWQHVFQKAVESLVEEILRRLPCESRYEVVVLGIPTSKNKDEIFFEPERARLVPADFSDVFLRAEKKYNEDPVRGVRVGAAHLMAQIELSLWPRALREAVLEVLWKLDAAHEMNSFCSFPVCIDNHWVMSVVRLERQVVDSVYRLQRERQQTSHVSYYPLQRSLLDAAVHRVLSESEQELRSESRGNNVHIADAERVLEDAAEALLSSISMRIRSVGGSILGFANAISAERYEGAEGRGRMLLAAQSHPDVLARIRLKSPVLVSEYRGVRKLLETSSEDMALLSDGKHVWGLGVPGGAYDPVREDMFELRFTAHFKWELVHAGNVMMRVEFRRPHLSVERFDKVLFRDHFERTFQRHEQNVGLFVSAVQAAVDQKHGAMVVITDEALSESARLAAQSTVIDAEPITHAVVRHVSKIDGAVLVAPDGLIHAFGVILDGTASANGTPTRGARFNSAVRYVDGQRARRVPCLALIVSEDGYVDLYPKLRPRVPRSMIRSLLNAIEELADPAKEFDPDVAWDVLSELDHWRFYLLENDVERANTAKWIVLERFKEARDAEVAGTLMGYFGPSISDFKVSSEMSDDYYVPEE